MTSFDPGVAITVENGRFLAHGVVIGPPDPKPYPEPRIKVEIFRSRIDVPIEQVRLAEMSAQRPWEDAPREVLESQLMQQAAQIVALEAQAQGMADVLAMQMEAINAPPVRKDDTNGNEWFEKLVDILETYLVREVGSRQPVRIANEDLRRLVSHILD